MVWAGVCYNQKLVLHVIESRMNSGFYCNMLEILHKSFFEQNSNNDFVF
ncbi:hypothetical protein AAJ76_1060005817 [Vairimorpha ceranae]|uniref:Uncharacterized protein n=1 Tax=Vairimorpha ceranae TaxID=40302 RepID=A0A0F9Z8F7_9MICR|nr:hypothetical protein AAJ76_1060005817 [Vairimorpha ceranae]KKO74174.1 hypothetical protein AAJ76_1060005817 [Vairimorpha ceranae]